MARCTVYRSSRKAETYLYLAEGRELEDLPEGLRAVLGEPVRVMELELDDTRRLARADVRDVQQALAGQGYFLQMPPERSVEEEISRRFGGKTTP
jgi:uncharacterized protein YcgL (UPF0745 family)